MLVVKICMIRIISLQYSIVRIAKRSPVNLTIVTLTVKVAFTVTRLRAPARLSSPPLHFPLNLEIPVQNSDVTELKPSIPQEVALYSKRFSCENLSNGVNVPYCTILTQFNKPNNINKVAYIFGVLLDVLVRRVHGRMRGGMGPYALNWIPINFACLSIFSHTFLL